MTSKSEMSVNELFPIQVLCNFINTYRGERETLTAFLTNCQNALELASENQKNLLFKFIISRLEGKAQITCSNKVFSNFEDLKSFLRQNFGERKHYNHLLLDLQSCKQSANESVAQFALKIESCLTDLQTEIHNSDSYKKDIPGRIAMTEDLALFTFCLGLNPKLCNIVRSRQPNCLNDAINIALEEEKIQNLIYNSISKSKCKVCGKLGHSENECFSKQRRVSHGSQPILVPYKPSAFTPYQGKLASENSSPIICRYCKNIGHDISQCRKRQYNNSRFHNQGNKNQTYYRQNQISIESPPSPVLCNENNDNNHLN